MPRLRASRWQTWGACGLLASLAACAQPTLPPSLPGAQQGPEVDQLGEQSPEVKIGLLLPLSGPAADLGQDMFKAAQMALFDVGPNQLVLIPRDTAGQADRARAAAQELIDEGVELFIGPLFAEAVSAVSPLAREHDLRVLAFSNVAEVAAPGTYLLGFRPEEQIERVVEFALERGLVRIAGLAPDDAYGVTALDALQRAVIAGGGELGETLAYRPELADPSDVVSDVADYRQRQEALEQERALLAVRDDDASKRALERLENLDTLGEPPFDAILLADGSDRLRSVASLLTFYDVDPEAIRFLGTIRWQDDSRVLSEGALQGGWFAAPDPETTKSFARKFETTFGKPPQALAALAYDATALAVITQRDLRDRQFTPATLTNADGFAGATGLFRLRVDGLAEHGLAIVEVRGVNSRAIDPPPSSFIDELTARTQQQPIQVR